MPSDTKKAVQDKTNNNVYNQPPPLAPREKFREVNIVRPLTNSKMQDKPLLDTHRQNADNQQKIKLESSRNNIPQPGVTHIKANTQKIQQVYPIVHNQRRQSIKNHSNSTPPPQSAFRPISCNTDYNGDDLSQLDSKINDNEIGSSSQNLISNRNTSDVKLDVCNPYDRDSAHPHNTSRHGYPHKYNFNSSGNSENLGQSAHRITNNNLPQRPNQKGNFCPGVSHISCKTVAKDSFKIELLNPNSDFMRQIANNDKTSNSPQKAHNKLSQSSDSHIQNSQQRLPLIPNGLPASVPLPLHASIQQVQHQLNQSPSTPPDLPPLVPNRGVCPLTPPVSTRNLLHQNQRLTSQNSPNLARTPTAARHFNFNDPDPTVYSIKEDSRTTFQLEIPVSAVELFRKRISDSNVIFEELSRNAKDSIVKFTVLNSSNHIGFFYDFINEKKFNCTKLREEKVLMKVHKQTGEISFWQIATVSRRHSTGVQLSNSEKDRGRFNSEGNFSHQIPAQGVNSLNILPGGPIPINVALNDSINSTTSNNSRQSLDMTSQNSGTSNKNQTGRRKRLESVPMISNVSVPKETTKEERKTKTQKKKSNLLLSKDRKRNISNQSESSESSKSVNDLNVPSTKELPRAIKNLLPSEGFNTGTGSTTRTPPRRKRDSGNQNNSESEFTELQLEPKQKQIKLKDAKETVEKNKIKKEAKDKENKKVSKKSKDSNAKPKADKASKKSSPKNPSRPLDRPKAKKCPADLISPIHPKRTKQSVAINKELLSLTDTPEYTKAPRAVVSNSKNSSRANRAINRAGSVSPCIELTSRHREKLPTSLNDLDPKWLSELKVPEKRLKYRVRNVSGNKTSEWQLTGQPVLKLVDEPQKARPQLHWTFNTIIRTGSTQTNKSDPCKILSRGDCIIVKGADHEPPFIAIVQHFWADDSLDREDLKASINWFYRANDIKEELRVKNENLIKEKARLEMKTKKEKAKLKGKNSKINIEKEEQQSKTTKMKSLSKDHRIKIRDTKISPHLNNQTSENQSRHDTNSSSIYQANSSYTKLSEAITDSQYLNHPNAIYASKHYDTITVASINDKCDVLTPTEYFKYVKRCRMMEQNLAYEKMVAAETFDEPLEESIGAGLGKSDSPGTLNRLISRQSSLSTDKIIPSDLVSINHQPSNLDLEDDRDFDATEVEAKMNKRIMPRPSTDGFDDRGLFLENNFVFFCPGMWDVNEKRTKKDIEVGGFVFRKSVVRDDMRCGSR